MIITISSQNPLIFIITNWTKLLTWNATSYWSSQWLLVCDFKLVNNVFKQLNQPFIPCNMLSCLTATSALISDSDFPLLLLWLMQGPTISPVYCERDGKVVVDYYAIVICVPRKALYKSVQELRAVSLELISCTAEVSQVWLDWLFSFFLSIQLCMITGHIINHYTVITFGINKEVLPFYLVHYLLYMLLTV